MKANYFADRPDLTDRHFRQMLERVAREQGGNTALQIRTGLNSYKKWNYRELLRDVNAVSSWLLGKGLKKGDTVGILMENRPEWCISYLGITCAGLTVVPLDILSDEKSIKILSDFSGIRYLFTSAEQKSKWQALAAAKEAPPIVHTDVEDESEGFIPFDDCLKASFEGLEFPAIEGDDTASIIFTSGTTGSPKGVMLSHKGIIDNINASIMSLPIYETDNFVAVLPFHHTYPTTCSFLSPIAVGGTVTVVDKIVGSVIIENIKETRGTHIIGVPLLFDKIRKGLDSKLRSLPGAKGLFVKALMGISSFTGKFGWHTGKVLLKSVREGAGLSSIRLFVAGGGPLNPSTGRFYQMLGFDIVQGYGMSENGPLIATNTPRHNNFDSVGLVVKYTDVEIRDIDAAGVGEIVVKSPSLMKGYYHNEEATGEMFTRDGFLKTGDLGYFDKDGFLYITGRSKSLIVSPAGKNIYPEEIEALFAEVPAAADVLVRGRPLGEGNRGEDVEILIHPDLDYLKEAYPDKELSESFLKTILQTEVDRVNRQLASYKRIVSLHVMAEEFEKTSSQKIKRFVYKL